MGTFRVPIEVAGSARDRFEVVDALVDTGATYTVLPRSLLERLGVQTHRSASFRLPDNRHVERDLGRAWVRVGDQAEYSLVVFGDDALLGAVTLEELGLGVDPIMRRLVPVPALMMRLVVSAGSPRCKVTT